MNSNNMNPQPLSRVNKGTSSSNRRRRQKRNKSKIIKNNSREEAPIAMGFRSQFNAPEMSSKGQNTVVTHREYVADINASINFSVVSAFAINPGVSQSFPWLSQVAQRFEKYRFRKLRYAFETTSPTNKQGSLMLVPDFDAEDPAPISKTQALSYKSSVRTQIWERITLEVKQEDLRALPQYYIRGGSLSGSYDIKTYDVGNLFVCFSGGDDNSVAGELWVEYEIELIAPNIQPDNLITGPGLYISGGGTFSNSSLFGTDPSVLKNGVGYSINPDGSLLTFIDNFIGMIVVRIVGASADEPQTFTLEGSATLNTQCQTIDTSEFQSTGMIFVNASAGQTFGLANICVTAPVTTQIWIGSYNYLILS